MLTERDYCDLFGLLLDGALYRANRGDDAALNEPDRIISLMAANTESLTDRANIWAGVAMERIDRAKNRAKAKS